MAHVAATSESSRLLVNTASEDSSPFQRKSVCISCPPSKHLCLPSKAAILILLWTIIVGAIYYNLVGISALLVMTIVPPNTILSVYDPLPYAILAMVMMFYPLSGFIADVCCGRLKTVVVSLIFLLSCWILVLISIAVLETTSGRVSHAITHDQGILVIILGMLSLFAFIIGLAGYQANFIQLGLDQLFEAPSQYLGLFVHYAIWAFRLGSVHFLINFFMVICVNSKVKVAVVAMQVLIILIMIILLLISYWKRRWFHSEPGHQNPYETVYDILKFAKSHKHPLRRSAFTHCDNYIPSRLDFAKERFGGPFTTEQVENVKTFFRILLVLFAIGPVFALEVPASYFFAPLFALHFHYLTNKREYCSGKVLMQFVIEVASLFGLPTLLLFPMCLLAVLPLLRKNMLKLFTRLGIGIFLCLLGVVCWLVTDIAGHVLNISNSSN